MKICGLQKTTLLDFPGHVAATIFTGGCNFRCPFCHNSDLLPNWVSSQYSSEEILEFLRKRVGILAGVCITGGEPTLQTDLEAFILKIRQMGLLVKLDTNGYRPDILKELCQKGLLDYVAMDIKASRNHYGTATGIEKIALNHIDESISFLLHGKVPFEFRTTVVKGIHTSQDFLEIGPWIKGCDHYFLQMFTDNDHVLMPDTFSSFSKEEMLEFAKLVEPYVGSVTLRGIDH